MFIFKEELTVQACVIYHHILMYMGDIPGRRTRLGMELTDVIFDGPLKHVSQLTSACLHNYLGNTPG